MRATFAAFSRTLLLLALATPSLAQWTNWRFWRSSSDGFTESFTRSIAAGADGRVVVRHGFVSSMSLLDGYAVHQVPEILGGRIEDWGMKSRAYTAPNGEIWAVDRGELRHFHGGSWAVEAPRDREHPMLAAAPRTDGEIVVLFTDRLASYSVASRQWSVLKLANDTCLGQFRQLVPGFFSDFWIAGDGGMGHLELPASGAPAWTQTDIHKLGLTDARNPMPTASHDVYVSTVAGAGRWALLRWGTSGVQQIYTGTQDNLRGWHGPDGDLWVLDGASLLRMVGDRLQPAHKPGTASGIVFDVFPMRDGSFWLATSDGVARFAAAIWRTPTAVSDVDVPVSSITEDSRGRLWASASEYLLEFDGESWRRHLLPLGRRIYTIQFRSMLALRDGRICVNTRSDDGTQQALLFDPSSGKFSPLLHPLGRSVTPLGPGADGQFWVLTRPGNHVELFDGENFHPRFDVPGPFAGDLRSLAVDSDGVVWVGGSGGLLRAQDGVVRKVGPAEGFTAGTAFDLLSTGHTLLAGGREKLLSFDGHKWTELRTGIDRVRMATRTHDGSLWVATGAGVEILRNGHWFTNEEDEGLPSSSIYVLFEDSRGRLWAGTTRGLALYHPEADQEAPSVGFSTTENIQETGPDGRIRVTFTGADKWKNTPADRLLYSYRLDSGAWSAFSANTSAVFEKLSFGSHRIFVRGVDRSGNIREDAAPFLFKVNLPWYRQPGFYLILFVATVVIGLLVALAVSNYRERGRFIVALNNARLAAETASRHKSAFLANMSHEIRTPMHAITGMTGLALEEAANEKQRGYLLHAQKASQSLLALMNDIVDFSKAEAGNVELRSANFSLLECLRNELAPLELQAKEKGLTMDIDFGEGVPNYLEGDDRRLGQVVANLVNNAVKFSDGGEIRLEVTAACQSEKYVELKFVVSDHGIGVPADKQHSIFGAFEQADGSMTRKYGGAGLGLAMCAKLVTMMDGRIWVESPWHSPTGEEVAGSAFHVTVRLRPGKAPEVEPPKAAPTPPQHLRILLAEDNPVNQKLVVHLLQRRGHTVAIANNGQEAVQIAQQDASDVVLMDVQMPEMDGFQATAAIRAWEKGRPNPLCIVALTAHAMDGDKERCLAHGFDLYLAKPFRPDELDQVLAQAATRAKSAAPSQAQAWAS